MVGTGFDVFSKDVEELLSKTAESKGYLKAGIPEDTNNLYTMIQQALCRGGHGHALGEIVMKTVRYAERGDKTELLKVAAWAYLIWQHHEDR
tara:strand:+ start:349 stop:624 length:276 start_codon:yes stop_codon:yes gene_type:complete